jgi:hypothetical protein
MVSSMATSCPACQSDVIASNAAIAAVTAAAAVAAVATVVAARTSTTGGGAMTTSLVHEPRYVRPMLCARSLCDGRVASVLSTNK